MDKKLIGYWIATALFALAMTAGGIMDVILAEPARTAFDHLGYPHYFGVMLGVAKLAGAAAIVAPGLRRVKEWAYAGFAFDLIAAAVSHGAVGDGIADIAPPILLFVVGSASYLLRPASRRIG